MRGNWVKNLVRKFLSYTNRRFSVGAVVAPIPGENAGPAVECVTAVTAMKAIKFAVICGQSERR